MREGGGRDEPGLDAPLGTDVVDRRRLVAGGDQALGDGERREDVTGGSAPGDDGEAGRRSGACSWAMGDELRATLRRRPMAVMVTSRSFLRTRGTAASVR